ncbi:uncharacterized protein ASCRUDRAFT_75258 [Ascoidea rubescens DSM 1968]|uniref:Uncharacterized protein n=1 Tax=Ascoidea rubescens DSM 1968 TaxID=1344418 RepID=A0A1D2VK90_9ASCO|nr:hypothetical protein ASCRUDRAFT_75258 [Ascoidea rubescens DSM 1968]ODV62036.1 hypothetical protein ASCRUDRAFT_75258 [Ascoidea rubescens DSM 1968]
MKDENKEKNKENEKEKGKKKSEKNKTVKKKNKYHFNKKSAYRSLLNDIKNYNKNQQS